MFLPSLLMKIGIIGIKIWILYIIYVIKYNINKLGWKNKKAIAIIYILISLGISSQFNPYLFNSAGMSIILFSFIEIQNMIKNNKLSCE